MKKKPVRKWLDEIRAVHSDVADPAKPPPAKLEKRWTAIVAHAPPRSIFYVTDIREFSVHRTFGFSWLGREDHTITSLQDMLSLIPDFQRILTLYQVRAVYRIIQQECITDWDSRGRPGFFYVALRAVKDRDGRCWLAQQTSEPWQVDRNGRIVAYLNWFHLLAPYNGEGIRGEFFHRHSKQHQARIQRMNNQLLLEKQNLLSDLEIPVQQREIMKSVYLGQTTQQIARQWGISIAGVRYHYRQIKAFSEELFHQRFATTQEAVTYLAEQQILV